MDWTVLAEVRSNRQVLVNTVVNRKVLLKTGIL